MFDLKWDLEKNETGREAEGESRAQGSELEGCYCLSGARGTSGGSLQINSSNGGQEEGQENVPYALQL